MPVISYGDESVGQSVSIYYFLAAETDFMGEGNMQAAQVLAVSEHLREMMSAYRGLVPSGEAPTTELSDEWFNAGSTDVTGTADMSKKGTRYLQWWMGRIETSLPDTGFAVGTKLSLADLLIYYNFAENLTDDEAPEGFPLWKRVPFGEKDRIAAALINYPKINACIAAVKANENFQKWLSIRGPQGF
jgi:glutathione S-transferase